MGTLILIWRLILVWRRCFHRHAWAHQKRSTRWPSLAGSLGDHLRGGRTVVVALAFGTLFCFPGGAAEPSTPPVVVPLELPERIQDELELEDLRREKERRDLELELGVNHDLEEMTKLLALIKTAEEVQDKLRSNPELRARYDRIVGAAGRARGCTCLLSARVLWLGSSASQADRADIRLGDEVHSVQVGGSVGDSRCRLDEILRGPAADDSPAAPVSAMLSCGGTRRERSLHSAVSGV